MLIDDLNRTLQLWTGELEKYSFEQLTAKPSPAEWSLGQVYMHLLSEAGFQMQRVKICLRSNRNAAKEAFSHGRAMLDDNSFPNERIAGPASNKQVAQPESKEALLQGLERLKAEVNELARQMTGNGKTGKVKHPGLGYFSAGEWLQFCDMHFRHHLRQKDRIDAFLGKHG